MFNIKEHIIYLMDDGLTREEALAESRKELKRRKKNKINEVKVSNDHEISFRQNFDIFKR